MAMVVVLPAPLPPSRPTQVPRGISKDISSTAVTGPKRLDRFSTLTAAVRNMAIQYQDLTGPRLDMAQTDLTPGNAENRLSSPVGQHSRARQVRLRTLVWIRWIAIAGQLAALLIVQFALGWDLPIDAALGAVGASVLINVVMTFRRPALGRLGELEVAVYLVFDIAQLTALLYLTGGLGNPFALLFLGPVTVSATIPQPVGDRVAGGAGGGGCVAPGILPPAVAVGGTGP